MAALISGMAACSDDKEGPLTGNRYSLTLTAGNGGSVSFVENEYTEGEEVTVTAIRNKRFITPCHCAGQTGENGDHSQRPGENLYSKQFRRSSRAGRPLRRDAHPYVAGQERTHQGAGLLPLRAGHHRRPRPSFW